MSRYDTIMFWLSAPFALIGLVGGFVFFPLFILCVPAVWYGSWKQDNMNGVTK